MRPANPENANSSISAKPVLARGTLVIVIPSDVVAMLVVRDDAVYARRVCIERNPDLSFPDRFGRAGHRPRRCSTPSAAHITKSTARRDRPAWHGCCCMETELLIRQAGGLAVK